MPSESEKESCCIFSLQWWNRFRSHKNGDLVGFLGTKDFGSLSEKLAKAPDKALQDLMSSYGKTNMIALTIKIILGNRYDTPGI